MHLYFKLIAGQFYINATNLLIPHIAHDSTTVACKLLGNDYTDICKTN